MITKKSHKFPPIYKHRHSLIYSFPKLIINVRTLEYKDKSTYLNIKKSLHPRARIHRLSFTTQVYTPA